MKIAADTNVLLRDTLQDDPVQSRLAKKTLQNAEFVAIPVPVLCEFVWVLRQGYKKPTSEIADAIRVLMDSPNVVTNEPAVEAGLAVLDQGGDFADGAIAFEGRWLGAEEFVSFDKQAVSLLRSQGRKARLLA
ncbi:MAG: type II toxin-antitoxin system VapC family toxin [Terracidiphilus sp.]|jgi:predicted nucleic-acid-binding protein